MQNTMLAQWITAICLGFQAYHYLVYPALLGVLAWMFGRHSVDTAKEPAPPASLLICAYNEAGVIAQKIANSLDLSPPPAEVIVVNDGSTDATLVNARAAAAGAALPVRVLDKKDRGGKSAAMNLGAQAATGDILVFSDASEMYDRSALVHLLAPFVDPRVVVVSGAHRLRTVGDGATQRSEGLYWRYEDFIRRSESALGSTVASVGAILAVRRAQWRPLPPGTVNDDAYIAMTALARGGSVRFAPRAIGWEQESPSESAEQIRRRRISAGRILLLARPEIWPWRRPFVLAAFFSHKVMRLALPLPMLTGLFANIWSVWVAPGDWFFVLTLALQLAVAALAIAGHVAERTGRRWRMARLACHVVRSNLSVLLALRDIALGRAFVRWDKPAR